ncbi:heme acquisition protein HasA [Pectobacterium cacticida]|uniref:heme acquisition protein HasA n=1 Tax=Pectobacterium cacticida TaxID=69221 RepID=UPI002FF25A3D
MAFEINYDSAFSSYSITSYLTSWATDFGDPGHGGPAGGGNSGSFYGSSSGSLFDGSQYGLQASATNATAFIADGDLHYSFRDAGNPHTLYGELDKLSFGEGLEGGSTSNFTLTDLQVSFSGLDLSSLLTEGQTADLHQAVYGLMRGDVDPLLNVLSNAGIDVTSSFADLSVAHATTDSLADATVDVVGVADTTVDLLAA